MRYLLRVFRVVCILVALASPIWAQVASGPDPLWTDYLPPAERARVAPLVARIEFGSQLNQQLVAGEYALLRDLYARARDERLDRNEYLRELETLQEQFVSSRALFSGARAEIREIVLGSPPPPRSLAWSRTMDWLAANTAIPDLARELSAAYARLLEADPDSLSAADALAIADSLAADLQAPADGGPLITEPTARLSGLLAFAALDTFTAPLVEFSARAQPVAVALETLSGQQGAFAAAALSFAEAVRSVDRALEVLDAAPAPELIAALGPDLFADPAEAGPPGQDARSVGELLVLVTADPATGGRLLASDASAAFALDTIAVHLGGASDLQRFWFAGRAGLVYHDLPRITAAIGDARRESRAPGWTFPDSRPSPDYAAYRESGDQILAAAEPWARGELSRSGDAYRWAMLPLLNHVDAQYRLATSPEHEASRRLVADFLAAATDEAARATGIQGVPTVLSGTERLPFLRVFVLQTPALAQRFALELARAAQGSTGSGFEGRYAPGLTVAEHWCITHGLLVLVEGTVAEFGEVGRADLWFELAAEAPTADEAMALLSRGLELLGHWLSTQLGPLRERGQLPWGHAFMLLETERLIANQFERGPQTIARALSELYGVPSPGSAVRSRMEAFLDFARAVTVPDGERLADDALAGAQR